MLCLCGLCFVQREPGMQSLDLDKYTCNLMIRLLDVSEDVLSMRASHVVSTAQRPTSPSSPSSKSMSSLAHRLETSSFVKIDLLLRLLASLLTNVPRTPSSQVRLRAPLPYWMPAPSRSRRTRPHQPIRRPGRSRQLFDVTCVLRWLLLQWHARPREMHPAIQCYLTHPDHGRYHLRPSGLSDQGVSKAIADMVMRHLHRHMRWATVQDAAQAVVLLEMYRLAIPCIPLDTYARSVAALGMQYTEHISDVHIHNTPQTAPTMSAAEAMPLLVFYETALAHLATFSSVPRFELYGFVDQAMTLCDHVGRIDLRRRFGHLYLRALAQLPRSPRTVLARIDILVTLQLTSCTSDEVKEVEGKEIPDMMRLATHHLAVLCQQDLIRAEERARVPPYMREAASVQTRLCQRILNAVAVLGQRPVSDTQVEAMDRLGHVARTAVH